LKLISDADLSRIDDHLAGLIDRLLDADGLSRVKDVVRWYVLDGGKRVRPQLCIWTWEMSRQSSVARREEEIDLPPTAVRELPPALLDVACGWELFHAFLLAHDDIIDEAETRRDRPALHRQLAALDSNCPKFGKNLAIVAGDLLFSASMRLWHELEVPVEQYRPLLRLFSRVASTTGFGQAIDICQSHVPIDQVCERTLLREYHWKTAAYTFEGPMLSGAIMAGADEARQSAISRYALALGQAYQLQNDLIDLASPVHDGCDLVQGKRTVTLVRARSAMSEARRRDFDRKIEDLERANGHTAALAAELQRELIACGAADRTRELVCDFLYEASTAADDPALPAALREGMRRLLESLQRQYFE
jgi:geranylgeranyl diphosphate synthase type I